MKLSDLGEFELIARIERAVLRAGGGAALLGIGDDAALLRLRKGEAAAVSTPWKLETYRPTMNDL